MSSEGFPDRGVSAVVHKVCRDFCRNEIEPVALELDEAYDPARVKAIWRKGCELDLPAMLVPEEFGGVGQSLLTAAQVLGEIAVACAGVATLFACHLAACVPVIEAGSSQAGFLAALAGDGSGELPMLALALPGYSGDTDQPRLIEKNGGLLLEGSACLVACASLADRLVLFARDEEGITPVLVEQRAAGVSVGEAEDLLGLHTVPFCDVRFEAFAVADDDVLGERKEGARTAGKTLAVMHGFLAAIATGTARCAHAAAHRYARERFQFGRMLVEHQEIRRMLSSMATKIDIGSAGYAQALSRNGLDAGAWGRGCARAKVFCSDAALETALDAIQIYGGYGYMKETGLEKIMRDAKMLQLLGGSNRMLEVE